MPQGPAVKTFETFAAEPMRKPRLSHLLTLAGLLALLALAFWLYARPGLMVYLAEQLWACF